MRPRRFYVQQGQEVGDAGPSPQVQSANQGKQINRIGSIASYERNDQLARAGVVENSREPSSVVSKQKERAGKSCPLWERRLNVHGWPVAMDEYHSGMALLAAVPALDRHDLAEWSGGEREVTFNREIQRPPCGLQLG